MSRSKPNSGAVSPVEQYFQWSGSEGKISYYDKAKGTNEFFPKMSFIVLDELHTITGFSDKESSSIRGTDVKSLDTPITMYIGKKKITTDTYENLKNITGVKYAKSLYVAVITKNELKICKILLAGAAFGAWLDFIKGENDYKDGGKVNPMDVGVGIKIVGKSKPKKKGSNTYFEPIFQVFTITEEQEKEAMLLDGTLQEYFENRAKVSTTVADHGNTDSEPADKKTSTKKSKAKDEEEEEDEDINADDIDDLPF